MEVAPFLVSSSLRLVLAQRLCRQICRECRVRAEVPAPVLVEAGFTALALYHGIIPPTINLEKPDPECDLDYVPNTAREARVDHVITNSFGFGGTNACLVLSRYG